MKKRLYLVSTLTALLFALGALVTFVNIGAIIDYSTVRDQKTHLRFSYYRALSSLVNAQKLLYKHQAGYEDDIDGLVNAVEIFSEEIGAIHTSYSDAPNPALCRTCHPNLDDALRRVGGELSRIEELNENYKTVLSMTLTTSDPGHRLELERNATRIGNEIVQMVEGASLTTDRMVAQAEKVILALTARARRVVILALLGVLAGLLLLLLATVPAITRSVGSLIRGTEAIAAGDLEQRVNVRSRDEIGLLAERFNSMANALQHREKELRDLNQTLEQRVSERTRELEKSYDKLRHTAAELERANHELSELDRLKSDFIAIASHELRTPLVTISGYIDLLREGIAGELTTAQMEMIDVAWKSSRRLTRIIKDILDISRIESRKLAAKRQPVTIGEVLEEAVADQRLFAEQRHQAIRLGTTVGLPAIPGDHGMLLQVFINLINNAIKFTPNDGEIAIRAQLRTRNDLVEMTRENRFFREQVRVLPSTGERFLLVTITDTGVGVPLSEQNRIFDKFYEVGDVKSHSSGEFKFMGGGIGLGLSICRGFIEEHGGEIWVESPGRDLHAFPGSSFNVLLPAPAMPTQVKVTVSEAPPAAISAASTPQRASGPLPTILIIDDDPDILRLMEVLLRSRYRVETAASGTEGLAQVPAVRPDVIFLDLLLYDIDGYEVCRRLKGAPQTRGIPIILFTAKAQRSEIEEGLRAGADDFLTKPFTNEDLFSKIESMLYPGRQVATES